ncbi:hypothetical protein EVAR_52759_1 [Eumeta japonica]|uniref:Uncharacterized protein n=1 Tax=Eumeta variegata TaxID=151549 RepID=A0A4C1XBJ7_EUMVA|nr:hypothetical protein EVAR_52759_1 [Eumeta japonica]
MSEGSVCSFDSCTSIASVARCPAARRRELMIQKATLAAGPALARSSDVRPADRSKTEISRSFCSSIMYSNGTHLRDVTTLCRRYAIGTYARAPLVDVRCVR